MAKIADLLREMPSEFVQTQIWARIGAPRDVPKNHGRRQHEEDAREIFRACKGQRMQKRVRANCTEGTGSIVMAVRTGRNRVCVCKHKM